jgi:uncharacterized repeat protein (TIGR01451 family)
MMRIMAHALLPLLALVAPAGATGSTLAGVGTGTILTATDPVRSAPSGLSRNRTVTGGPSLNLVKSVAPSGAAPPGTELSYSLVFTNGGDSPAYAVALQDPVPAACDFKLGSIISQMGTTGLVPVVAYSRDNGSTWAYVPLSGGGGAPPGFDRTVTTIRWTLAGALGTTAPANQGMVGFVVRVR